ncbi:MAG: hypothetical protein HOP30_10190 [Cyclobacteriaceae bacterium]|nr:hypothetical protein [Cyclobacteriaceae bacterium]
MDRGALAKLHPSPYQKRIKNLSEDQIIELKKRGDYFQTVFENALYRITHQRIEYYVKDDTDPINEIKIRRLFDFFDETRIVVNKHQRNKKTYWIKPSLFFVNTLKNYTLMNPKKYFLLSKRKVNQTADLYIYLNYVKQTLIYKNQTSFPVHKNLIIKILNCPEFSRDRKKNETIDLYLKEIQAQAPELGLIYAWKPNLNNPMFKDYCIISFNNIDRTKDWMYDANKKEERTIHFFGQHLSYRLLTAMKEAHPNVDLADFDIKDIYTEWLSSPKDFDIKIKAYQDTYYDLWKSNAPEKYPIYYFNHYCHLSGEFAKRTI